MRFHLLLCIFAAVAITFASERTHAQESAAPSDSSALAAMSEKLPLMAEAGEQKLKTGDIAGAAAEFQRAFEVSSKLADAYPQEPVYRELMSSYLDRLATIAYEQRDFANAANQQEASAQGYEALAAKQQTPDNKKRAADAFGTLAWYQLANQDPSSAVASARKGLAIDPAATWLKTNLAHGLMLSRQTDEALAVYRSERAHVVTEGRTFEQAVLSDFDELEKLGIRHQQFDAVRQLYAASSSSGTPVEGAAPSERQRLSNGHVGAIVVAVLGSLAAFVGLLGYAIARQKRNRAASLAAVCNSLGYRPRATTSEDLAAVANTHLLTRGRDATVSDVIEAGDDVRMFDFSYTTGSGDTEGDTTQTVVCIESPELNPPPFVMSPASFLTKIFEVFGYKDIDFSDHPRFSEMYLLRGADEAAIREVFTPAVLEYFEQNRGLTVESVGNRLLIYRDARRVAPQELEAFVNKGREIAALFSAIPRTVPPPLHG